MTTTQHIILNDHLVMIERGALEHWINHNYLVAQGIKNSEEWLDQEDQEDEEVDDEVEGEVEGETILFGKK